MNEFKMKLKTNKLIKPQEEENYYIIYDENKKEIGCINAKYEKMQQQWLKGISVFVITKEGKLILEQRTKNTSITPNEVDLCSGHRDNNEKGKKTAFRELKEELGIRKKRILKLKKIKKEVPLIFKGKRKFYIQFYMAIVNDNKNKIQKSEVDSVIEIPLQEGFEMIRQGKTKFPYVGNEEKFEKIFEKIEKKFYKEVTNKKAIDTEKGAAR